MTLNNRRFVLRWLRKLFDWLEDRLHTEEVKLRNELSGRHQVSVAAAPLTEKTDQSQDMLHRAPGRPETVQTEPPSDKGAVVAGSLSVPYKAPKTTRQRRHVTASAFDLRFSR